MKTRIKEITIKYPNGREEKHYYPQYYIGFWSWDNIRLELGHDGRCHSLEKAQVAVDDFVARMKIAKEKDYLESNKKVSKRYIKYP